MTHHSAVPQCVVHHLLCMLAGKTCTPLLHGSEGSSGTGADPHLSGASGEPWLGLMDSSNPTAKPDDVPSLPVRPPSLEQFWLLPGLQEQTSSHRLL